MTVSVLTQTKEAAGELTLPPGVFDGPVRHHLLHEAVKMQRANRRAGTAASKTRRFVGGGGEKTLAAKGNWPRPRWQQPFPAVGGWGHDLWTAAA